MKVYGFNLFIVGTLLLLAVIALFIIGRGLYRSVAGGVRRMMAPSGQEAALASDSASPSKFRRLFSVAGRLNRTRYIGVWVEWHLLKLLGVAIFADTLAGLLAWSRK